MKRNWWIPALRGIAAIVLGITAWLQPDQTLMPLVALFGVFAVPDSALHVAVSINLAQGDSVRWLSLIVGVVGALLGLVIISGATSQRSA